MKISGPHQFEKQVGALISQMTLEEKLAQLGGCWVYELHTNGMLDDQKVSQRLTKGIGQITRNAGASDLHPREAAISANRLQRFLKEQTRLGIPAIIHEECCVGLMSAGSTVYPQIIGLASTFRPELAERMMDDIRKQMRAIGAHQGLAPVLDVARDPRWGRIEETFGEDPTLVSQFGTAYIRGLQGEDLSNGVMATGKHFVGHSLSLGGMNCAPVHLGMRELWDVYLAPFQAAIRDAGLAMMMNAYPQLDGEVVAASRRILTDLLREQLGFNGLVVSDYEAIIMIHNYHYAAETKQAAAAKALNAGIDVELPTVVCYGDELVKALKAGEVSLETIDLSVSRHLQKKFELGLFENPYVNEDTVIEIFETDANRALAYEIACQSMVLLKNDGVLPLKPTIGKLAVIGPNADSARNLMGDYSYNATAELLTALPNPDSVFASYTMAEASAPTVKMITVLEGIREVVSAATIVDYAQGCEINSDDENGFAPALALAQSSDAVVLVMGGKSGLTWDCTTGEFRDATDLGLPGVQEKLINSVLATGKPVALVLVNGRPAAIPEIAGKVNAILEAWIPGEEGGRAVAAALFGNINPGGKLPLSIPRSVGQIPVFYNHKPSGMHSNIYGDYYDQPAAPLYCFGHGLSYTTFEYSALKINHSDVNPGEKVDISLEIRNNGLLAGDEVVQLYLHDEYASFPRPVKELKGFTRIQLQPGEKRLITFHLDTCQLAYYDENLELVLEPGQFSVMIGSSSEDIRLTGTFTVKGEEKLIVKDRIFVCPVSIR